MKRIVFLSTMAIAATALGLGSVAAALGQQGQGGYGQGGPGGPPPFGQGGPGRGPGGGPGRGPGGPSRPGFGPRGPMTAATVPTDALAPYLNLSAEQRGRIEAIHDRLRAERPRPPAPPRPEDREEGAPPPRPSREEMERMREKMEAAMKKADEEVQAILTASQREKLPTLLKAFSALRDARIMLSAAPQMKLSNEQISKLAALGARPRHEQVTAILTAEQRQIADENRVRGPGSPGRPDGGRGGFGGPGGGPGGPPPFGGPPPGGEF